MKQLVYLIIVASGLSQAQSACAADDIPVTATATDQARLGISTRVLEQRTVAASVDAVVRSIDPAPLAALDADLDAATAALRMSHSELRRIEGLARQDQSASQQALEAAQARADSDAATLTLLQRRLEVEWGTGIAALSSSQRSELVKSVASGTAALLRADAPLYPEGIDGDVLIPLGSESAERATDTLGFSGSVDQRMQTVGLFCVVHGAAAAQMRPGRVLQGRIQTGSTSSGVVLPRSSLVRLDGAVWAYVATGEETFVRREVVAPQPLEDGWFVTEGFAAGTAIVDRGAGALVAIERADESAEVD